MPAWHVGRKGRGWGGDVGVWVDVVDLLVGLGLLGVGVDGEALGGTER
jgi:hypothetical protein